MADADRSTHSRWGGARNSEVPNSNPADESIVIDRCVNPKPQLGGTVKLIDAYEYDLRRPRTSE